MSSERIIDFDSAMAHLFSGEWEQIRQELSQCIACPRYCSANRFYGPLGYCRTDAWCNISSICVHRGEEPTISGKNGICNVFFSHCNLQCIYCQNHQISSLLGSNSEVRMGLTEVVKAIITCLDAGCKNVGFVSPSHQLPQMKAIIRALKEKGYKPVFVYNTNGYDTVASLRSLEDLIDVYLPDLKYMNPQISGVWSDANDYPEVAMAALKEMFRQKGTTLRIGEDGIAESGLIIRHLVLPSQVQNSIDVLGFIAGELSPRVHVSLMSQYYPTSLVMSHPQLGRSLHADEYARVLEEMERLGLTRGWIQEMESTSNYRPDFQKDHPFEHDPMQ